MMNMMLIVGSKYLLIDTKYCVCTVCVTNYMWTSVVLQQNLKKSVNRKEVSLLSVAVES